MSLDLIARRSAAIGACVAFGLAAAMPKDAAAEAGPSEMRIAAAQLAARPAPKPQGAEILARAWPSYRERFVSAEGRVVDNGNGGISHSEGQGYGMLLAVAAQDRETFERLWSWTQTELAIRPDGLSAWRWQPGKAPNVPDLNNASDGDILIAWALAEAGIRWNEPKFSAAMRKLTAAIFAHNVIATRVGPVLLPGAVGFGPADQPDGPVVNLSYWVFPAIDRLQVLDPAQNWAALRRSGLRLLRESRFGPLSLPPEWLAVGTDRSAPALKFERTFGYNAIRIPLYLAWSSRAATDHLQPYLTMWNFSANLGPFVIGIDDGKARDQLDAPGYRMIFSLVQCRANRRPVSRNLASLTNELYYPATLGLLSILAISERRPECL